MMKIELTLSHKILKRLLWYDRVRYDL